jgi:hypothetical protein
LNRQELLNVAGAAAALISVEAFFAFGLSFAPGWANGWGIGIHIVWPAGMAVVVTAMLLTATVGVSAVLLAEGQPEVQIPGRKVIRRYLAAGIVAVVIVWGLLFALFRSAALAVWPDGYNPRGPVGQQKQ